MKRRVVMFSDVSPHGPIRVVLRIYSATGWAEYPGEYVVHTFNRETGGFCNGYYTTDLWSAMNTFVDRCKDYGVVPSTEQEIPEDLVDPEAWGAARRKEEAEWREK